MITIQSLAFSLPGTLYLADNQMLTSLCYDSRTCNKGSAFFCFTGIHTQGVEYIDDAIARGAVLIVTSEKPKHFAPHVSYFITTGNIRTLYARSCSLFFERPWNHLELVGITGTDGKSSTCDFTYQLFNKLKHHTALLSTVYQDKGNGKTQNQKPQTTPEAWEIQSFLESCHQNDCQYAVLEASSHALSPEYNRLADVFFAASGFTRISSEHLEFHRNLDRYIDAKCNLARHTTGPVFVYDDNLALTQIRNAAGKNLHLLTHPQIIHQDLTSLTFAYEGAEYSLPFGQDYNLENAFMAANIVSTMTSTALPSVLALLKDLKPVSGRFLVVPNTIGRHIIIDYAHTADAFYRLFSQTRNLIPEGDFIALFGASGNRDASKRPCMGKEAARMCKTLVITEDDPREEDTREIANEIISGIDPSVLARRNIFIIPRREDAIAKAIEQSEPGDTIFLLGKGHENDIKYAKENRYYSEVAALDEVLRTHTCSCRKG